MDSVVDLLATGAFSPEQRIWGALAPVLVAIAYPTLGVLVYAVRILLWGPFRDPEISERGSSALVGMEARQFFAWLMQPVLALLRLSALPATSLTTLSVLLATAAAVAVGAGRFSLGGWLYVLGGLCDFFDGRIARATGTASRRGAALDSILDRYSDGVILIGLSWYYRDSWVLLVIGALMIATFMVSYVRARGEPLGVIVKVGLMQRPERIVYLGLAVALAPVLEALYEPQNLKPGHWLAVLGIVLITIATAATAVHRVVYLLRALRAEEGRPSWMKLDRRSLVRFSISSALATGVDLVIVVALVGKIELSPWLATFLGCAVGAAVNLAISRIWTFNARAAARIRMSRYGFASASSALLNAGGVAVLLTLPRLDYRIAWAIARGAVFLFWNFPLNREYMFTYTPDSEEAADTASAARVSPRSKPGFC